MLQTRLSYSSSRRIIMAAPPRWLNTVSDAILAESWPPLSGAPYDWERATQENYHEEGNQFTGRFEDARRHLDYSYHRQPAAKRQVLQDAILNRVVQNHDGVDQGVEEKKQLRRPWLVLSAGPMGVGKSYVLSKLHSAGYFPLDRFLMIDPDMIKTEIPEFAGYLRENPDTAATLLHGESTQMADILFQHALASSSDMLVDGSLRDVEWYTDLISNKLRKNYPNYRIAILHVTAKDDTIRERARQRAKASGRAVPAELLEQSIVQVPNSVQHLAPLVDVTYTISNNEGEPMQLLEVIRSENDYESNDTSMLSWNDFAQSWQQHEDTDDTTTAAVEDKQQQDEHVLVCSMTQAWTDTETHDSARAIWGASYPSFCPRCTMVCDAQCGICIHGTHTCACEVCRG